MFPEGTPGIALDALARLPLWSDGLNYRHGTGACVLVADTCGAVSMGLRCEGGWDVGGVDVRCTVGVYEACVSNSRVLCVGWQCMLTVPACAHTYTQTQVTVLVLP